MRTQKNNITPSNDSVGTGRRATKELDVYVMRLHKLACMMDGKCGETNADVLRRSARADCRAMHATFHTLINNRIAKIADNKRYKRAHLSLLTYVQTESTSLCKHCTARNVNLCAYRDMHDVFLGVERKRTTSFKKTILRYAEYLYILHLFFGADKAFFLAPRATIIDALVARYTRCRHPCVTLNVDYDASRLTKFGRSVYKLMVVFTQSGDNVAAASPVNAEATQNTQNETNDQMPARPRKRVHFADEETRTLPNTAQVATTVAAHAQSEIADNILEQKVNELLAQKVPLIVEAIFERLQHHMLTADRVTQQDTLNIADANARALIRRVFAKPAFEQML